MRVNSAAVIISFFALWPISTIEAQNTVQSIIWNTPNGKLPDFSQTFNSGITLALSWNAWLSPSYLDASALLLDLWVTNYDLSIKPYTYRITTGLNLTFPGSFAWTISIPNTVLSNDAKFVLRFKDTSETFEQSTPELSSPGILILKAADQSTTTFPPTSAGSNFGLPSAISSGTAPSAIISSAIGASFSASPELRASTGNGLGESARIAVGVTLTIVILSSFAGLVYFLRRRSMKEEGIEEVKKPLEEQKPSYMEDSMPPPGYVSELPSKALWSKASPTELPE